jgi:hypothetical protein
MECLTAFHRDKIVVRGSRAEVAAGLRGLSAPERASDLLIFDDQTGRQVDLDLRADASSAGEAEKRSRGRPRLGVTAREVTLLPRHWDWLAQQPGGASAVLRRLVQSAMKSGPDERAGKDAAYHFLNVMAGDRVNFEEAMRALYADDKERFELLASEWPGAVLAHARNLAWPE